MNSIHQAKATFTRPANTTAYADNDLVANSTTAASVTPMEFTFQKSGAHVVAIRIEKSDAGDVANADFSLNFYMDSPTPANGDNGAISTNVARKLGTVDVGAMVAGTDDAYVILHKGDTGFLDGLYVPGNRVYALLEANAAYVPASAEVFTVYLTYVG